MLSDLTSNPFPLWEGEPEGGEGIRSRREVSQIHLDDGGAGAAVVGFGAAEGGAVWRRAQVFGDGLAQSAGADAVDDSHLRAIGQERGVEKFFELAQRVGRAHPDQVQLVALATLDAEGDGRRLRL